MELIIIVVLLLAFLMSCVVIIQQGTVAVITLFGKYSRIQRPGLNFKLPVIESIYRRISIQNRAVELEFQAITGDQANVYFKAMLVYAVVNHEEESIKNVAFKFMDERSLMQALTRTIEGTIRAFVATKKQAEILGLRTEIVTHVKEEVDDTLLGWGYHLMDLQLNDITFDEAILRSMAQVVATNNLKAAAENEGQALLITKTKAAEAEGNAIRISADAERMAAQLRGQGIALFRKEVTQGMATAVKELKDNDLDSSLVAFSMWTETIKHMAEYGKGNVIFLDASNEGLQKSMKQMIALSTKDFLKD
jgi:regulator of protease activity HflC (stomatin/prohibitin superfamily)